jgi:hypothetical protein
MSRIFLLSYSVSPRVEWQELYNFILYTFHMGDASVPATPLHLSRPYKINVFLLNNLREFYIQSQCGTAPFMGSYRYLELRNKIVYTSSEGEMLV